jgi:hypothetical protein
VHLEKCCTEAFRLAPLVALVEQGQKIHGSNVISGNVIQLDFKTSQLQKLTRIIHSVLYPILPLIARAFPGRNLQLKTARMLITGPDKGDQIPHADALQFGLTILIFITAGARTRFYRNCREWLDICRGTKNERAEKLKDVWRVRRSVQALMEAEPETGQCEVGDAVCFFTSMLHFGPLNDRDSFRGVLFIPFEGAEKINYSTQFFLWDVVGLGWGEGPQKYRAMNACRKPTTDPIEHFRGIQAQAEITRAMEAATGPGGLSPFVPYPSLNWPKVTNFVSVSPNDRATVAKETAEEVQLGLGLFIGQNVESVGHGATLNSALADDGITIILVLAPCRIPNKTHEYKPGDLFLCDEVRSLEKSDNFYFFKYAQVK